MKEMMIIPIFISHMGCQNDCIFCNQKEINGCSDVPSKEDVVLTIERYLETGNAKNIGIAFYGGSFTGLDESLQKMYLEIAYQYKRLGKISHIRLSTRPDYIDVSTMIRLKHYGVDLVELGVQSFDDLVLSASNRGHDAATVYLSVKLIRQFDIGLGIQLMFGLPEDNRKRFFFSVREAIRLKPDVMRIYPTLVLKRTELARQFLSSTYEATQLDTAINVVKDAVKLIVSHDINLIRIGLQETDLITKNGSVIAGPYHPAFRDLVYDAIYYDCLVKHTKLYPDDKHLVIYVNPKRVSHIRGQNRNNQIKIYHQYGVMINKIIQTKDIDEQHIAIQLAENLLIYPLFDDYEVPDCI